MGRFEPEDKPAGAPPAVGTATQDLRATVEAKLYEIVEAAEARAHEIEDRALEQALEIEQDSERKGRGRFQSSSERTAQMLAAIDTFESEFAVALKALRERAVTLAIELGFEAPAEPAPEQDEAAAGETLESEVLEAEAPEIEAPEAEMQADAAEVEAPEAETPEIEVAAEAPETQAPKAEATATEAPATTDDAREEVRRQILDLFMAGKPRVDAERLLSRLEDGGRYIDLLDEVYEGRAETQQGGARRRRGGRRRRRPGSP